MIPLAIYRHLRQRDIIFTTFFPMFWGWDLTWSALASSLPQVSVIVGKKRNIAAEKRQKKEQKDEAEKHMEKQEELVR